MRLLRLDVTNFKKLRQLSVTLSEGLNVIVGDNAAGKSTLLQAIECALYGASVVPGKADSIPTWGQSSWKVVLCFSLDGDDYRLTRSKSTARLEREGLNDGEPDLELVANGHTPVTKAVAELLDLDAKDYNLFMQSKQGETAGVLTFGAAALNRKVEAFAGISLIDRVQSLAQEEYREARTRADTLSVDAADLDAAEQQCHTLGELALDAEKAVKDAQQAYEALPSPEALQAPDVDPDALQARLSRITRLTGKVAQANTEVRNAQERCQEAQQRFEELDVPEDAEALAARLNALGQETRRAASRVSELSRRVDARRQLWDQLVTAERVMDDDLPEDEIRRALAHETAQQAQRHEQRRAEQHRVVELNQQITQLQSLRDNATCPTCGTRLSEHDPEKLAAEVEQLARQRVTHEQSWDELTRTCQAIDEQVRQLECGLETVQAHEAEVDRLRETLVEWPSAEQLDQELRSAKETHEGAVSDKAALEYRLEQLEGQQRRYRRAERAVATENRALEEFLEERQRVSDELEALRAEGEPTEASIEAARQAHREYDTERHRRALERVDAEQTLERRRIALQQALDGLERAREGLNRLRDTQDQAQRSARAADVAGRLSRFLRERRAGYLQEVWDAVLAAASRQVNLASKGMVTRLVYDAGDFLFEEEGILAPVASASGAQKAHIGVALRIGLSRALYGRNALIIFDEPTESMSEHHAAGLAASLAGAAAQCLLITHREQDQDLAAHVVEVAA